MQAGYARCVAKITVIEIPIKPQRAITQGKGGKKNKKKKVEQVFAIHRGKNHESVPMGSAVSFNPGDGSEANDTFSDSLATRLALRPFRLGILHSMSRRHCHSHNAG